MVDEALEEMGLRLMKEYIWRRQAAIAEHITNIPIYELCTGAEWMPGSSRFLLWQDQDLAREEEGNGARKGAEREVRWNRGIFIA